MFDAFHGGNGIAHHLAGKIGLRPRFPYRVARFAGAFGRGGHVGGDLFQRGGCLFQGGGLLFGAAGKIVGCRRHLVCAAIHRLHGLADAGQRFAKLVHGAVEIVP